MSNFRRTNYLVDREVQGMLMLRVAIYWLFCLLSVSLMLICWNAYTGPSRRFIDLATDLYFRYGPALAASLLVLPIVMMDVVRLSNRFVGPVFRLRQGLTDLANGRPPHPMNFREHDFWSELGAEFNRAAARVARDTSDATRPTEDMPAAAEQAIG
jgi:hypothetical protein